MRQTAIGICANLESSKKMIFSRTHTQLTMSKLVLGKVRWWLRAIRLLYIYFVIWLNIIETIPAPQIYYEFWSVLLTIYCHFWELKKHYPRIKASNPHLLYCAIVLYVSYRTFKGELWYLQNRDVFKWK